jgi:hypothetical protein
VSSAQVAYKWVVVQGYALAFKADTLEYLEEDIDLFSFDFTKASGCRFLPIALVCFQLRSVAWLLLRMAFYGHGASWTRVARVVATVCVQVCCAAPSSVVALQLPTACACMPCHAPNTR